MIKFFKTFTVLFISFVFIYAGTDGTIRGKVTDIENNPLPGANIYVPTVGVGAAADMDGNYIILNIPVGEYDVVVQMMGYQKQTITGVNVVMDQTSWLNFKLPVAAVEGDEIQVIGEKPLVEKGTTSKKSQLIKKRYKHSYSRFNRALHSSVRVVKVESRTKSSLIMRSAVLKKFMLRVEDQVRLRI